MSPTIEGQMCSYQRDEFKVCHLVASPHTGHRTHEQASGVGAGFFKVAIATHGRVTVQQYDRVTTLTPGELTLYDTSDEYSVGSDMPFGVRIALLPKGALEIEPELATYKAVTKLEGEQARGIRDQLLNLREDSATDTWEKISIQLGQLLLSDRSQRLDSATSVILLVKRVQTLVTRHLDDPRLSPDFLAARLGISRRQLYAVCRDQLGPIATYIRRQRLEYSRMLLADEYNPTQPMSIADVALASGFEDPAHFSRLFRAHYGFSPTAYRQLAEQGKESTD